MGEMANLAGDRVLVRPFFHIPVRPTCSYSYQSPYFYPGTIAEITACGWAVVQLDDPCTRPPWEHERQIFHPSEIHSFACGCELCGEIGRDINRYRQEGNDR